MRRSLVAVLAWACVATPIGARAQATAPAATATAEPFVLWMRMLHDEWAVPGYVALDQSARALTSQIEQMCAAGTTDERVNGLRQTWLDTMLMWRRLEAFQYGPTLKRRTSKVIDFWPSRPNTIEQAVTITANAPMEGPGAQDAMDRWGTATKGLPAIEWMLFAEPTPPIARSANHCRYATRLGRGVVAEVDALVVAWKASADQWRSAIPSDKDVQEARHVVLNLMVGNAELLRGRKLDKAAKAQELQSKDKREQSWDAFDSMRSHNTQRFLVAHEEAVAQVMIGQTPGLAYTQAGPRWGLDDVLIAENPAFGRVTSKALQASLKAVHAQLLKLPPNAQTWSVATVAPAVRELVKLRAIIDPPVAKHWKVSIEFTDADGD